MFIALSIALYSGFLALLSILLTICIIKQIQSLPKGGIDSGDDWLKKASEAYLVIDNKLNIKSLNKAAINLFQATESDLLGKNIDQIWSKQDAQNITQHIFSCLDQGSTYNNLKFLGKKLDKTFSSMVLSLRPLLKKGEKQAVVFISEKNQKDLISDKWHKEVVEHLPDAVFWINKDGGLKYVNEMACRLFDYTKEELKEIKVDSLISGEDEISWSRLWRICANCKSSIFEWQLRNRQGQWVPVEVLAKYIEIEGEKMVCAYVRNITTRKFEEQQMYESSMELERKNEELEQFAYIASHNLQEPLRMIASFAQIIDMRYKGQLDNEADEFISFVVDGVKRMQLMLNDLARYSDISLKARQFNRVNLNRTLKDCISKLEFPLLEYKAKVTFDELPEVRGNEQELLQLFQNIIRNSLKYKREEEPKIHISTEEGPLFWTFSIKDNGQGMEADHADKIFKIFNRLDREEGERESTGMGLAICYRIIEKHGGQIWMESKLGIGSTFFFTIPKPLDNIYTQVA